MEFKVKFNAPGYAVNIKTQPLGLKHLDEIRELTQTPKLPAELVDSYVPWLQADPEIKITEDLARRSGLFDDQNTVQVEVDTENLNRFVEIAYSYQREVDSRITRVSASYSLNKQAVLEEWEAAGCPLKWELESDN